MANKWLVNQRMKDLADHLTKMGEWNIEDYLDACIQEAEAVDSTRKIGIPEQIRIVKVLLNHATARLAEIDTATMVGGE